MSLISRQIALHEQKARTKYTSALQHLGENSIPGWFNNYLEKCVIPSLGRVGFDREIIGTVFRISSSSWKLMGIAADRKIMLHPALKRHVQEIQRDVMSNSITWIILPRAHAYLTQGDSLCLLEYLKHMEEEANLAFKKILARIVIEFVGNYSLKFVSPLLPEKQVIDAVFYGYAAMFWKNLRQPPPGLEDLLIFRNYLYWAKAYNKRASHNDPEKKAAVDDMEEFEDRILPDRNTCTSGGGKKRDAHGMLVALRHGRPGINHALKYFIGDSASLSLKNQGQLSCKTLPRPLKDFLKEVQNNYDSETPRAREFIHTFLLELKRAYGSQRTYPAYSRKTIIEKHAFTQRSMAGIVQDFMRTLH